MSIGLQHGVSAQAKASKQDYRIALTVPSTNVGADLTDFPVYVDLSTLPAVFWTHVRYRDGRDLRVRLSGGTEVPFDLVRFDREYKQGALWYKKSLSSSGDTAVYLHYGKQFRAAVQVAATNGRNAVWSDYHRVFMFGESFVDRCGSGNDLQPQGAVYETFELISTSGNTSSHQGVAFDGTYYYVIHTDKITKYDLAFSQVAQNASALTGITGVNHLGDGDVHDGVLYIVVETYVDINTWSGMQIARFNASDLSLIGTWNIAAQNHEVSSVVYCEDDGVLYVTSFNDGSKFFKYSPADGTYLGTRTLSSTIAQLQGITFWRGAFWVNEDVNDSTIRVEYDGTVRSKVWSTSGGSFEGIAHSDDSLLVFHDTSGSATGVVKRIRPRRVAGGGGVFLNGSDSYFKALNITRYTTWTIGVSASISVKGGNHALVTYGENNQADDTVRASLAFRNSTDQWGSWNSTDSWLLASGSPVLDRLYRFASTYNGTTSRKLYVDGTAVSATPSTRPGAAANCLYIGIDDATLTEEQQGTLGFLYLRNQELTSSWLTAEWHMLNNDMGGSPTVPFITVGAEEVL
jgi:hypothetical protein